MVVNCRASGIAFFGSRTIVTATPRTLAALGGVMAERSGVVNIAMEGMMLTGAFFAVTLDVATHNVLIAVAASMIAGGLMALIHAVVSIRFRADQIVSGFAINLFAGGVTGFWRHRVLSHATPAQWDPPSHLPNDTVARPQ